jgi:hypothetical protein
MANGGRNGPFAIRHSPFAIRYVLENAQNGKGQLLAEVGMGFGIGATFAWDRRRMRGPTRLATNLIEPKTQR